MSDRDPSPEETALAQQVFQYWNNGDQAGALDALRREAIDGSLWAAALLSWLLPQQGLTGIQESIDWAIEAARGGKPQQASYAFNNALAYLPSDPSLAARLPQLLDVGAPYWAGVDLVSQGWNLIAQGHPTLGLKVMTLNTPWPISQPLLNDALAQARQRVSDIEKTAKAAHRQGAHVDQIASESIATVTEGAAEANDQIKHRVAEATALIETLEGDLKTTARQADLLVRSVSSDATNALYLDDALRNTRESRGAWKWGLAVLGGAALVAILPVVLHYLQLGPEYSAFEQLAVHLASTAALATFAGVLLARARSRDHAAQRARELSTAMGTMISYSNQISDPLEKQRFMTTMGQLILQAHLTSGTSTGGKEDSAAGMIALANLIKPGTQSGPTPT